jgi:mRNA deadenylase 3'-5' endonuclease subunit Ccr4
MNRRKIMNRFFIVLGLLNISFHASATVEDSILPSMDNIYNQDFGSKVNSKQKELMQHAVQKNPQKLRLMTYNMLYNATDAEKKLPPKNKWDCRKPRLLEYLYYAKADIIGSQELQEDQIQEVMSI